jgi:uncharacterized RDD family membrane protein YckC
MSREIHWGLFGRRLFAFLIDALIFVTIFSILIRVFNLFMPGNDVRESAMQFYTEKDFNVFAITSASALSLLAIYMFYCYQSKRGQTIGHRVARIRIRKIDGSQVGFLGVLRITLVAWIRLLVLLVPGPFFAFYGGNLIGSVFFLIWGCLLILPIPISKSSRITLWQKLGGYKFESL